jgi:hypothetical protein
MVKGFLTKNKQWQKQQSNMFVKNAAHGIQNGVESVKGAVRGTLLQKKLFKQKRQPSRRSLVPNLSPLMQYQKTCRAFKQI